MAQQIFGDGDESTKMLLGQIRKVFDPRWLQAFDGDKYQFTVQFKSEPESEDELIAFADMYGYSLCEKESDNWSRYYFTKE